MEPNERLIVAIDTSDIDKAGEIASVVSDLGVNIKLGLEFFYAMIFNAIFHGIGQVKPFETMIEKGVRDGEALRWLMKVGRLFSGLGPFFADTKLMDIPNTVGATSMVLAGMGVKMFNVHCFGGRIMMARARVNSEEMALTMGIQRPLVIAVTLLTSLDQQDLIRLGVFAPPTPDFSIVANVNSEEERQAALQELGAQYEGDWQKKINARVTYYAKLAKECGLDGVVCSPLEARSVKEACGPEFLVITPGIRPSWAELDDQKRTATPLEAIKAGADYIVVGRPVFEAENPKEAVNRILEEIYQASA